MLTYNFQVNALTHAIREALWELLSDEWMNFHKSQYETQQQLEKTDE